MGRESAEGEKQFKIEERLAMIAVLDHELKHLTDAPEQNAESIISKTELRNKIAGELNILTGEGKEDVQARITEYKDKKILKRNF